MERLHAQGHAAAATRRRRDGRADACDVQRYGEIVAATRKLYASAQEPIDEANAVMQHYGIPLLDVLHDLRIMQ